MKSRYCSIQVENLSGNQKDINKENGCADKDGMFCATFSNYPSVCMRWGGCRFSF